MTLFYQQQLKSAPVKAEVRQRLQIAMIQRRFTFAVAPKNLKIQTKAQG